MDARRSGHDPSRGRSAAVQRDCADLGTGRATGCSTAPGDVRRARLARGLRARATSRRRKAGTSHAGHAACAGPSGCSTRSCPAILEQKVTGREAASCLGGSRARASASLHPDRSGPPRRSATVPAPDHHDRHVAPARRGTQAGRDHPPRRHRRAPPREPSDGGELRRRLLTIPGVGPWTAAEVAVVALGDPDAVSVGDYHLPHAVTWTLAGEPRGDDARMLELLAPFAGHRGRVVRLIEAGGMTAPRRGPRMPLRRIQAH